MKIAPKILMLVFAGGAVGTMARYVTSLLVGDIASVIFVNLVGTAFLAWFTGVQTIPQIKLSTDEAKAFWATGFAGGFTTMSGLALWLVLGSSTGLGMLTLTTVVAIVLFQFVAGVGLYLWIYHRTVKWAAFRVAMANVVAKAEERN